MTRKAIATVVGAWVLSLVSVAVVAQSRPDQGAQVVPSDRPGSAAGPVITGADIAFQPIVAPPPREGAISGVWMVRTKGRWMEAQPYLGELRPRK